jgi:hypothetical protein
MQSVSLNSLYVSSSDMAYPSFKSDRSIGFLIQSFLLKDAYTRRLGARRSPNAGGIGPKGIAKSCRARDNRLPNRSFSPQEAESFVYETLKEKTLGRSARFKAGIHKHGEHVSLT